jgi:hypothetical protein
LLLLYAADQAGFIEAETPAWVSEWLASRAERASKKAEAPSRTAAPVDVVAQGERREKRMDRIVGGLSSLRTWLDDLIRQGIASIPSRGYAIFDEQSRRMIDAQAPGVARMVQELATTAASGGQWHKPFLQRLASLHLLLRAAERLAALPETTREDLMAAIGVPIPQEEVLARPPLSDIWQIVAQEVEFEGKLRVQRTWVFGVSNRRPALLLHFAHGAGPMDANFLIGTEFAGELCYFPGNGVRAVVKSRQGAKNITVFSGYEALDAAFDGYSQWLTAQPWLGSVAIPLRQLTPIHGDNQWSFADTSGSFVPARMSSTTAWRMMAVSGGHPLDVAAEFDGETLRPLAVGTEGQTISLVATYPGGIERVG